MDTPNMRDLAAQLETTFRTARVKKQIETLKHIDVPEESFEETTGYDAIKKILETELVPAKKANPERAQELINTLEDIIQHAA